MEAGIPVVGTRVGAIPEVMADGETGIVVPPRDPDALATALVHLLRHPETAVAMGEAGRRLWRARFTVERYRRDMLSAMTRAAGVVARA